MQNLKLNYNFSVAPMMGVTTSSARYMYRLISSEAILFTEMIASQALYRGDHEKLLKKQSLESPVVLQVGGSNSDLLRYSTNLANQYSYQGINLNVGCLMKEASLVKECVSSMIKESSIDVSLKCRIGVDEFESYDFFKEFISTVAESGCKIIFVHARKAFLKGLDPKKNRTIPPLKYEFVHQIKQDYPDLKFIMNGGLNSIEECHTQLKYVDGVMVGRAIQANPFFLEKIDNEFYGKDLKTIDKIFIVKKYFNYIKNNVESVSTYELLSPLLALCFGVPGSKKFKQQVNDLIRARDIKSLENTYLNLLAA